MNLGRLASCLVALVAWHWLQGPIACFGKQRGQVATLQAMWMSCCRSHSRS